MALRTRSRSSPATLVADASVAINLNATGCAGEILAALPHSVVIVDVVVDELDEGRQKGRRDADQVRQLASERLFEIKSLGPDGLVHFEELVVGIASE